MKHPRHPGRQASLFAPRVRLPREARQAASAALAQLIAAVLRPPAPARRRKEAPDDGTR